MKNYLSLSPEELAKERETLEAAYGRVKARRLSLNIARGLPSASQLSLSDGLFTAVTGDNAQNENGTETRQYGSPDGIPEAKRLMALIAGTSPEHVIVTGTSSLNTMYDALSAAMLLGSREGGTPWCRQDKIKFICVVPGYDRHFAMTELFGIEMVNVRMTETGPDMDAVEALVRDPAVKGMWCVPKFSNPTGVTYSGETVRRIAALRPASPDFRVFWDNAYAIHDFIGHTDLPDILSLTEGTENEDMVWEFVSTAKITIPGGGLSAFVSSERNLAWFRKSMSKRTICYDKPNQLRHARFLPDEAALKAQMEKHAAILRPKFETVLAVFDRDLSETGIASYSRPTGGYFVSLDVLPGTAGEVYRLCAEAGLTLTKVGATFPYGKDPDDKNLRIAPTYPELPELTAACEVITLCTRLAAVRKLLAKRTSNEKIVFGD